MKHKDKLLHAGVCCVASAAVALATFFLGNWPSVCCGLFFALGLGLGKEYGDSKAPGNRWDWWDVVADVVGMIAGAGLVLLGRALL